ncbi:MAG: hypothetical protein WC333_02040 [Dehalococcoidia bacterium]|jgi:hypothetical protein
MFKAKQQGFKTLQEVQAYLQQLPFVNFGGCGIAALAMYRWLKKNRKASRKICFYMLADQGFIHENNAKCLEGEEDRQPTAPGHMVLYDKGKYFDCGGTYDPTRYNYHLKVTKEQFIVESLNNVPTWREDFPRKYLIGRIAQKLNIDLSDVVEECDCEL